MKARDKALDPWESRAFSLLLLFFSDPVLLISPFLFLPLFPVLASPISIFLLLLPFADLVLLISSFLLPLFPILVSPISIFLLPLFPVLVSPISTFILLPLFPVQFLLISFFLLILPQTPFGALPTLIYVSLPILVVLTLLFFFFPPTTVFLFDVWLPLLFLVDPFLGASTQLTHVVALYVSCLRLA